MSREGFVMYFISGELWHLTCYVWGKVPHTHLSLLAEVRFCFQWGSGCVGDAGLWRLARRRSVIAQSLSITCAVVLSSSQAHQPGFLSEGMW